MELLEFNSKENIDRHGEIETLLDTVFKEKKYKEFKTCMRNLFLYAKIVRCIDGDTVEAIVQLYDSNFVEIKVRLNGIDAPEMRPRKVKDVKRRNNIKEKALETKRYLEHLVLNKCVVLMCYDFDNFGRLMADIKLKPDSENTVSSILVEKGLAKPYKK